MKKKIPPGLDWIAIVVSIACAIGASVTLFEMGEYELVVRDSVLQVRIGYEFYAQLQAGFCAMLIGLAVALVSQILDDVHVPRRSSSEPVPVYPDGYEPKRKATALLLCIFLGWVAAHRFYAGRIWSGILMLAVSPFAALLPIAISVAGPISHGAFSAFSALFRVLPFLGLAWFFWWLVDLSRISSGKFTDKNGRALQRSGPLPRAGL